MGSLERFKGKFRSHTKPTDHRPPGQFDPHPRTSMKHDDISTKAAQRAYPATTLLNDSLDRSPAQVASLPPSRSRPTAMTEPSVPLRRHHHEVELLRNETEDFNRNQQQTHRPERQTGVDSAGRNASSSNQAIDTTYKKENRKPLPLNPLWRFVKFIPQPVSDEEVKKSIKSVFLQAEQFVDCYYSNKSYDKGVPDECLERTNSSSIFTTSELQEYLSKVNYQITLIKHELVALLLHLIDFNDSTSQRSLMPRWYQNHAALQTMSSSNSKAHFSSEDKQAALNALRVLIACVHPNLADDIEYHQRRHELIESVAATFERNFSHWAQGDRRQRRVEMRHILNMTADLGIFLFSQPATFAFRWAVDTGYTNINKIPIWPEVVREIDNEGMATNKKDVMLKARCKNLFFGTASRQGLPTIEPGSSSVPREPSISSGDETDDDDEDGNRVIDERFNHRDDLSEPHPSVQSPIPRGRPNPNSAVHTRVTHSPEKRQKYSNSESNLSEDDLQSPRLVDPPYLRPEGEQHTDDSSPGYRSNHLPDSNGQQSRPSRRVLDLTPQGIMPGSVAGNAVDMHDRNMSLKDRQRFDGYAENQPQIQPEKFYSQEQHVSHRSVPQPVQHQHQHQPPDLRTNQVYVRETYKPQNPQHSPVYNPINSSNGGRQYPPSSNRGFDYVSMPEPLNPRSRDNSQVRTRTPSQRRRSSKDRR